MYVCICNAIRESELRRLAKTTSGNAEATYACMGKTPKCGQCLVEADKILDEERGCSARSACCKEFAF